MKSCEISIIVRYRKNIELPNSFRFIGTIILLLYIFLISQLLRRECPFLMTAVLGIVTNFLFYFHIY